MIRHGKGRGGAHTVSLGIGVALFCSVFIEDELIKRPLHSNIVRILIGLRHAVRKALNFRGE